MICTTTNLDDVNALFFKKCHSLWYWLNHGLVVKAELTEIIITPRVKNVNFIWIFSLN